MVIKPEKKKAKPDEQSANLVRFWFMGRITEDEADAAKTDKGKGKAFNLQFEADNGDNPYGQGGADIRAHDHPDGILHAHNAGSDKSQNHQGNRGTALEDGRDKCTAANRSETAVGIKPDHAPESLT